jgi:hypothetical protein
VSDRFLVFVFCGIREASSGRRGHRIDFTVGMLKY